mgnify:CR=1 FL=1
MKEHWGQPADAPPQGVTHDGARDNRKTRMDRWTEIELFVQVAETGSLSRAAEALNLSNASASRHLAALEDRLGARLVPGHGEVNQVLPGRQLLPGLAQVDDVDAVGSSLPDVLSHLVVGVGGTDVDLSSQKLLNVLLPIFVGK